VDYAAPNNIRSTSEISMSSVHAVGSPRVSAVSSGVPVALLFYTTFVREEQLISPKPKAHGATIGAAMALLLPASGRWTPSFFGWTGDRDAAAKALRRFTVKTPIALDLLLQYPSPPANTEARAIGFRPAQ